MMRLHCRSLGIVWGSVLALAAPALVQADAIVVNIHDGQPWNPLYGQNQTFVAGNFMPGLTAYDGVWVNRIWFYHGGNDYAYAGVPYAIHVLKREVLDGGGEVFFPSNEVYRETTCNFCWEEVLLGTWVNGHLNANKTLGVFFRPLGGSIAIQTPRIWVDRFVNYEHAAASLDYSYPVEYTNPAYFSDYGIGEVMLGAEISGDVIVPTGETSFSAIKSLY